MATMTKALWSLRWVLDRLALALSGPDDQGGHRFVDRRCLCGQRISDDPRRCEVRW